MLIAAPTPASFQAGFAGCTRLPIHFFDTDLISKHSIRINREKNVQFSFPMQNGNSIFIKICGTSIFAYLEIDGTRLPIYTPIGLTTRIGLISKHAIIIVNFANQLQGVGINSCAAIEEAACIRLRPILMGIFAILLSIVPLIRFPPKVALSGKKIKIIKAFKISMGAFFSLNIMPAAYFMIGQNLKIRKNTQPNNRIDKAQNINIPIT